MESMFGGEAVDLTRPGVLWLGDFRPVSEIPPPVRHAAGYDPFATLVAAEGTDPAALAADVRLLVAYLRQRHAALRSAGDDLLDSVGIFLGNALISRVDDGRWQRMTGSELEVTQGVGGVEVLRMVRAILDADDDQMLEFDGFLHLWDGAAETRRRRQAAEDAVEHRLELVQAPAVPSTSFEPPSNGSLIDLLRALLDYLTLHYEATASNRDALDDDPSTISPTVETICIQPASPQSAPLIIAIDDVGAIAMRAGAFTDFFFYGPHREDLVSSLLAIAAGLYREAYLPEADDVSGYRLSFIDRPGGSSTQGSLDLPPERLAAIARQLEQIPDGWAPWPLRARPPH